MAWSVKLLRWLYPLFAFLLPLQTRWIVRDAIVGGSVWDYGRVSVYSFDLVLLLINLLIYWFIARQEGVRERRGRRWWAVAAGVLFVACELLVSLDPALTAVVLGRLLLIGVAGWWLVRRADGVAMRRALAAFVFAVTLSAGFGAAQFFAQNSLVSSKWLGVSWQEASQAGVSVVESPQGRWLRAHGTMPHPNVLGGFSAIALMVFLVLISTRRSVVGDAQARPDRRVAHVRPLQSILLFCRNIFVVVAPLVLIAGVITSASRAAIIAMVLGLAIFLRSPQTIFPRPRSSGHDALPSEKLLGLARSKIAIVLWVGGIIVVLITASGVIRTRFTAQGRLESLSVRKRTSAFIEAGVVLKRYGIAGTGLGAYTVALQRLYPDKSVWDQQPVHNIPVLIVLELGLGGMLIVMTGYFLLRFKFPISNFPRHPKSQIPVIVCWFILAVFDHYLWTLPAGVYFSSLLVFGLWMAPPLPPLDTKASNP